MTHDVYTPTEWIHSLPHLLEEKDKDKFPIIKKIIEYSNTKNKNDKIIIKNEIEKMINEYNNKIMG